MRRRSKSTTRESSERATLTHSSSDMVEIAAAMKREREKERERGSVAEEEEEEVGKKWVKGIEGGLYR